MESNSQFSPVTSKFFITLTINLLVSRFYSNCKILSIKFKSQITIIDKRTYIFLKLKPIDVKIRI